MFFFSPLKYKMLCVVKMDNQMVLQLLYKTECDTQALFALGFEMRLGDRITGWLWPHRLLHRFILRLQGAKLTTCLDRLIACHFC